MRVIAGSFLAAPYISIFFKIDLRVTAAKVPAITRITRKVTEE